mmetsp:Transcript_94350/g.219236  ORF Transcript_94350/g.219236 Transcript_94350/m.219236 type:complete len:211 (-) Transcript_94350:517-1149(-)
MPDICGASCVLDSPRSTALMCLMRFRCASSCDPSMRMFCNSISSMLISYMFVTWSVRLFLSSMSAGPLPGISLSIFANSSLRLFSASFFCATRSPSDSCNIRSLRRRSLSISVSTLLKSNITLPTERRALTKEMQRGSTISKTNSCLMLRMMAPYVSWKIPVAKVYSVLAFRMLPKSFGVGSATKPKRARRRKGRPCFISVVFFAFLASQ